MGLCRVVCLVVAACVAVAQASPLMTAQGGKTTVAVEALPNPVLPEQVASIISPPASRNDDLSASDVSEMFLTSRSDSKNRLMDSVKTAASQARSMGEAAQLMGLTSPIGLDSAFDDSAGMDGMSAANRGDFMSKVQMFDAQMPTELTSPSGSKLSLTSFPQLLVQANALAPMPDVQTSSPSSGVSNVPQGLRRISQEFGSTISGMASHIGRLFGPSPSYNGPCQCRACLNVVHRLRITLFENTYHYGVEEIDQELNDRFCYGERWIYRSTCYNLVGKYREMLKILVWLGTKEFDVCSFLFQCYPTSNV